MPAMDETLSQAAIVSGKPVARTLPPDRTEWARVLHGTPMALMLDRLDPTQAVIVVVELDGRIVSHWAAMNTVHLEGVWQAEDIRGQHIGVTRALLREMATQLTALHVPEVLTTALTPAVEKIIEDLGGTELPGTQWVIPVGRIVGAADSLNEEG